MDSMTKQPMNSSPSLTPSKGLTFQEAEKPVDPKDTCLSPLKTSKSHWNARRNSITILCSINKSTAN